MLLPTLIILLLFKTAKAVRIKEFQFRTFTGNYNSRELQGKTQQIYRLLPGSPGNILPSTFCKELYGPVLCRALDLHMRFPVSSGTAEVLDPACISFRNIQNYQFLPRNHIQIGRGDVFMETYMDDVPNKYHCHSLYFIFICHWNFTYNLPL